MTVPDAEQVAARVGPPPAAVRELAAGAAVVGVWRNAAGGLTFRLGEGAAARYVKWAPSGVGPDLGAEARRLRWAAAHVVVPRVLGTGRDADGSWLHTTAVPGGSAAARRWRSDPLRAARAIGRGLRMLHDTLPVASCPFDWGPATRLPHLAAETGRPVAELAAALGPPPPVERLVVCHGDACVPNTLLDDAGELTGHVDLGALGVADRWADLAVASWSTVWNFGPGYEVPLLAAYGVEGDPVRMAYYRALWGGGPDGTPGTLAASG